MAIQSLKLNCFFFPQLRTTSAVVVSVTCRFSVMENMSFSFVGVYLWVVYMSHLWKKVILLNTKAKCLENDIRSDQISCSVMSNSLRPHESQHTRPPCPSPTPGVHPDSRPSSQWCHPAISSSVVPFSSCPQSLSASGSSNESTLHMKWPKCWSFSFSISPSKEHPGLIFFRMDLVGSPCSPRDSQESSPTSQFKSINSSALSFLHSPTLTSIHDCWKNHTCDETDLCWQSNVSAF